MSRLHILCIYVAIGIVIAFICFTVRSCVIPKP